jgi:hypothetical protein
MKISNNQKILIGLGVVVLGYYLYTKNKNTEVSSETVLVEDETSNAIGRRSGAIKKVDRAHKGKCACRNNQGGINYNVDCPCTSPMQTPELS